MWHWGNVGSFLAGLSTVIIAVAALIRSPGAVRDWRTRQRAQAEKASEEAENLRLERQRYESGWSASGTGTYAVSLVTDDAELERAARELASDEPTAYVVLRVDEGGSNDKNRGHALRSLIKDEGHLSRPPSKGELQAVRLGMDAIGFPRARPPA